MGANAQTSVPTFTAGEVLTAANMNISARTGVPVFADTTARDAGFGGTGEKTLAEGQLCYLESTNVVQYYDGATWATVGPTTVSSGLTRITGGTLSGATTTITNAFSSTYANYLITIHSAIDTASTDINFRLGTTATGYYYQQTAYQWGSNTSENVYAANGASYALGIIEANQGFSTMIHVFGPNLAEYTYFTAPYVDPRTNAGAGHGAGVLRNTTQYTSFTLQTTGTFDAGTVNVYGYALS